MTKSRWSPHRTEQDALYTGECAFRTRHRQNYEMTDLFSWKPVSTSSYEVVTESVSPARCGPARRGSGVDVCLGQYLAAAILKASFSTNNW